MLAAAFGSQAQAQVLTFAGNPQHTGLYGVTAQAADAIKWQTTIEFNTSGAFAHYGMPLVTSANTVLVPQKTATNGFQISAYDGSNGSAKYTLTSDYVLPSYSWIPVYQPTAVPNGGGTRLYYAGVGGTIWYVDGADSNTPTAPTRLAFYGNALYTANPSGYNSTIFVDTPITADANGTIYFGFRVQGTTPALPNNPAGTTISGYARIDSSGNGTYVLVNNAAADANISKDSHNAAPAVSNDGSTIYVVCKWATNAYYGYLLGLDSTTLATKYKVFLKDPRNNNANNAGILDDSTASPMVAPNNDVFLGVFGNPYNGSRGWLVHFSPDLATEYTPGAFGWDYTPAIVPASMVPSYHGPSSYLIFAKYNNYANVTDGDGINKIAILDPNQTQIDPHPTAPGQVEMREVMTMIGVTPDSENPSTTNAIREWCINAAVVNPATGCVYFDSEDGHLYSWNLTTNSLNQAVTLTSGIGEPYVPSTLGPDGTIYTLNGTYMFAIGNNTGTNITLDSSEADARIAVAGDNITFTATLSGGGGIPTGTVTFTDHTFNGFNAEDNVIASNVPLDINGVATASTSSLSGWGGAYLGNHWITASYSGDGGHAAVSTTRIQKVHGFTSSTSVSSSASPAAFGSSVTFTASVTSGGGTPSGMVAFFEGNTFLAQRPLSGGTASFSTSALSGGAHTITASYWGDTVFASSSGNVSQQISDGTSTALDTSLNPATYGQTVTFSATVTATDGGAGTPAGSVAFMDGNTTLATVPVDSGGHATYASSSLSVGTHSISASFTGSGGWSNSSSSAINESIVDGTSTTLASNSNPAAFGTSVTFTATVVAVTGGAGTPTGSVTFTESGGSLATVPVDGTGHATYTTSSLSVGTHNIGASFTGSGGWSNSLATNVSESITDNVNLGLVSNNNPATYGQSVTFTATASATDSGAGTPTGSVTFKDGGTPLATVAVNGAGVATYSSSSLSVGSHSITATFVGTGGWNSASASGVSQSITDGTTSAMISSLNPAGYGQNVTFTVTVSAADGGAGTPTGSVTFKDGNTTLATVAVNGSGQATYSSSSLSVGTHSISASFAGSGGWNNSNAAPINESITDGSQTSLASSLNPSTYGQSVTFTAAVTPADSGAGTPTGSVTFSDGATTLATVAVDGTGHATYTTTTLSVGTHNVGASFTGSGGWGNSAATNVSQSVTDGTNTALASSANPSNYGSSVTFTATVTSADAGAGIPTGSVTFKDGSTTLATVALDGTGHATYSSSTLSLGSHSISAVFAGSGGWGSSGPGNVTQTVQATTSTAIASSLNPSVTGQNVTFTATVTSGAGTPTGSVVFMDGATTLATVAIDGTGHASYSTSSLAVGSHSISANFTGTGGYQNSSNSLTQSVTADTTAPSTPTGISATPGPAKGQVTLNWNASSDPDSPAISYEVWRGTKVNGSFSLLATVTTTSYVDNAGKGQTKYYYVIAKDAAGNRSARSSIVSGTGLIVAP